MPVPSTTSQLLTTATDEPRGWGVMATGGPESVVDVSPSAPPGGIERKGGRGFRGYTGCREHMREPQLYQPLGEGAVALPLKYTVAEQK